MNFIEAPSPNSGERKDGKTVSILVLHYTDTKDEEESLRLMQDPAHQAAAHYLVGEDGRVWRLVGEDRRAWHAGKSCWRGEEDVNSASIGIEIQNPGHGHGLRPFTQAQMAAVKELCREIIARHGIAPRNVVAHSDIAPERKKDPGELFPWAELAAEGIGLWPEVRAEERDLMGEAEARALLSGIGYDPRADFAAVMTAFQRRFYPESFTAENQSPAPDAEAFARLRALARLFAR
jgi:N-acetylmuramoyl-L-alanine amidase